jgi:hypothetical protein
VKWISGSVKNNRACRMSLKKEYSKRGQKRIREAVKRILRPKISILREKKHLLDKEEEWS